MPKLRAFVVCEKVIFDDQGVATLVALFTRVNAKVSENLPENAAVPKEWAVFSMWERNEGDHGEFVQHVQILWPNDSPFVATQEFSFRFEEQRPTYLHRLQMNAFPLGQSGKCTINTWVTQEGQRLGESMSIQVYINLEKVPENESKAEAISQA